MMTAFTRNYEDNSTEAGFQFTFYCDICNDGCKSSFIESETYKKGRGLRGLARGAGALGGLFGEALGTFGYSLERSGDILSERFEGMSPEWQKGHEKAFDRAQNEARQYFRRCHGCNRWACDSCFNTDESMCTECAPRRNVAVAKATAQAMQRNLDDAAAEQTIWSGKLQSQTVTCPVCGRPAGTGKFCQSCGTSLQARKCPNCGAALTSGTRFCGECGKKL